MKQLTTLLVLFFSMSLFSQSPWTKKKGEGYLQLSFTTISYDKLFGNPDYNTERKINDNTLQLFGEIGLSDKTTIFATLPLKMQKTGNLVTPISAPNISITSEGSETTIGNIQLGLKQNFYNKNNWVISGQLGIEANTGNFDIATGLRSGADAWTFTPLFLAGKSFRKSYFQSFTRVDIRTYGYSSNFKIGGESGGQIFDSFWLIGFLDIVKSFENGDFLAQESAITGTYVNDQEYGAFGAKVIYEFSDKFGLNAGFGGAFFGNNVAKAPALSFGLYTKF